MTTKAVPLPCFKGYEDAWLIFYHRPCVNCLPEYQAEMKAEGKCMYLCVTFKRTAAEGIVGIGGPGNREGKGDGRVVPGL